MKVSLTFCISSNDVLKLLTEMEAAESNFTLKEKIELENFDDLELIKCFNEDVKPEFSKENIVSAEIESIHGVMKIVAHQTWMNNLFAIGVSLDEDSQKDRICTIQFNGARGSFIKFVEKYFMQVSRLVGLILLNDNTPIHTHKAKDVERRNCALDLYESDGPLDMLPWETRASYAIRKGNSTHAEEIKKILRHLIDSSINPNELIVPRYPMVPSRNIFTIQPHPLLRYNDALILKAWVEDKCHGAQRVTSINNYVNAQNLANALLQQI